MASAGRLTLPVFEFDGETETRVTLGEKGTVQPVLTKENTLLLDKARAGDLTQTLTLPERVNAPVAKGEPLGELTPFENFEGINSFLAGESVAHVTWRQMMLRFLACAFCVE